MGVTGHRRMLASAGIDCRVQAPGAYSLDTDVDALLAWTVREGATNIVRHSGARHAEIAIEVTDTHAAVALTDDGGGQRAPHPNGVLHPADVPGPYAVLQPTGSPSRANPPLAGTRGSAHTITGSGLAGLAERAARLGATLSAGTRAGGGFRLAVIVPLPREGGEPGGAPPTDPQVAGTPPTGAQVAATPATGAQAHGTPATTDAQAGGTPAAKGGGQR